MLRQPCALLLDTDDDATTGCLIELPAATTPASFTLFSGPEHTVETKFDTGPALPVIQTTQLTSCTTLAATPGDRVHER